MSNSNYVQAIEINNLPKGTIFVADGVTYEITHLPMNGNIVNKSNNRPYHWCDLFYINDLVNVQNSKLASVVTYTNTI